MSLPLDFLVTSQEYYNTLFALPVTSQRGPKDLAPLREGSHVCDDLVQPSVFAEYSLDVIVTACSYLRGTCNGIGKKITT